MITFSEYMDGLNEAKKDFAKEIYNVVAKYNKDAKVVEDKTSIPRGETTKVRTLVIGVNSNWVESLIYNLKKIKFAKANDTYAMDTQGGSIKASGFDHTILIRLRD